MIYINSNCPNKDKVDPSNYYNKIDMKITNNLTN
jgi:hypothetical protein